MQRAWQALGIREHALDDLTSQHLVDLELVAVLLVTGFDVTGIIMLDGVLAISRYHTIKGEA